MDSLIRNYSEHILLHMQGCIDVGEEIFKVLIYSIFIAFLLTWIQKTIFYAAPGS